MHDDARFWGLVVLTVLGIGLAALSASPLTQGHSWAGAATPLFVAFCAFGQIMDVVGRHHEGRLPGGWFAGLVGFAAVEAAVCALGLQTSTGVDRTLLIVALAVLPVLLVMTGVSSHHRTLGRRRSRPQS